MKRGDLKQLIRAYVPSAKVAVISDTLLNMIVKRGVDDVNEYGGFLLGSGFISVVAGTQSYEIFSSIEDFYAMGKSAVWWYNGIEWRELVPKTRKTMNEDYPYWRDAEAGTPIAYFVENGILTVHPKPLTSQVNGFRIDDYIKAAAEMDSDDDYPFSGSTTEMINLRPLDDAIIDYCRWKLALPLGKEDKAGVISQSDYEKVRYEKSLRVNTRNDIIFHRHYRMRARTRRVL